MQYEIFEGNMERLEKKLLRICNKCKAYGCEFTYHQVGETFKEITSETGRKHFARFIVIEAEGTAIINGWEFAATIDHTEKGNIIRGFSGIEIPERYRTVKPVCEHCRSNRVRKYTYLVRNKETGEFKQVGKSCLNDYTHGMSTEFVAQYISFFDSLIEEQSVSGDARIEEYIDTREYLKFAAETVRCFGYVKANEDGWTTSNRALCYYDLEAGNTWPYISIGEAREEWRRVGFAACNAEETVQKALDWIAEEPEHSTYISNLKTACSLEYNPHRNIGILASLFPAYYRAMKKKEERESREETPRFPDELGSEYVGQPGEHISIQVAFIKCIWSKDTEYGESHLYKIISKEGNVFLWKTYKTLREGEYEAVIAGTVKSHNEFRNIKQTEVTRCFVQE